jgi:hypothetical protein
MYHVELSSNRILERVASPRPFAEKRKPEHDAITVDHQETQMMVEDIRNSMIHGRGIDGNTVSLVLKVNSHDVQKTIAQGLSSQPHPTFRYAASRFLKTCFNDLAWHGISIHEVAYERERKSSGLEPPDGFRLFRVDPVSTYRRWWGLGQLVQESSPIDRSEYDLPEYIPIRGGRFTTYQLPDSVEIPLRKAMEGLEGTASHEILSSFPPWERSEVVQTGAYKLSEHDATRRAAIAAATKRVGWTGRGQFNQDVSGHYIMRRRLRFERYVAVLRESLLEHLNVILNTVGNTLGFDAKAEFANAPSPEEFSKLSRELEKGERPFSEIMPF